VPDGLRLGGDRARVLLHALVVGVLAGSAAILLRYLQTLTEIGVEKNTTIIFPLPVELLSHFIDKK